MRIPKFEILKYPYCVELEIWFLFSKLELERERVVLSEMESMIIS